MSESRRRFMWNVQLVKNETYSLTHTRTIWEPWIFIVSSRLALTASLRKQKGNKYTHPKTNQKKKKNAHVYKTEWTGIRGQFPGRRELLLMGLLTHTSRIPVSRGSSFRTAPALQCWEANKTKFKNYRQQNDKEQQHNLDGLELSIENKLTLLEHSPSKVGMSDPQCVHPGWPAALGHLFLCCPVALELLLLQLKTASKCSLKGTLQGKISLSKFLGSR